jgi:two-component system cell cycle response regulator CtrA
MNPATQSCELARLRDRVEELEGLLGTRTACPRPWRLTGREAQVFGLLMRHSVCPRERIFAAIWGYDSEVDGKIVDVTVCHLRRKLRPLGLEIRTEYGVGYFLTPDGRRRARAMIAEREPERPDLGGERVRGARS